MKKLIFLGATVFVVGLILTFISNPAFLSNIWTTFWNWVTSLASSGSI